jgi:transposase
MKREEISNVIENIKPAMEAIADNNVKMIIDTLLAIIGEQQKTIEAQQKIIETQNQEIEALKEKLNTNSDNSSKPPSANPFKSNKNNKQKGKRTRGGQPGHPGVTRNLLPESEVDHIEKYQPPSLCECGGEVKSTDEYSRHQVHDIPPITTVVTEHQLFFGCCEDCGKTHQAELPPHVPTGMLGPYLLALIATLTSDYKMSKRDVSRFLMDFYSFSICIATVKRAEETVSAALEKPVNEAKDYVKEQEIVNADETSHAECGKRMWTWVAIAGTVAIFLITATRSKKAAKELLGAAFKGILGSDRYPAYLWIAAHCRQVCWAHLKRDFKKISERPGKSKWIGLRLLVYTKRMFNYWHQVRDGTITREQFKKLMAPIRHNVELLLIAGTTVDHLKTQGTCFEILKIKAALWTFIDKIGVEPTNNIAEQVLRKIVLWRKVCFGTWSANGTLYLERVMTVVSTCRLQNRSVYGFLREAIQAHLEKRKSPSLLPESVIKNSPGINLTVAA